MPGGPYRREIAVVRTRLVTRREVAEEIVQHRFLVELPAHLEHRGDELFLAATGWRPPVEGR